MDIKYKKNNLKGFTVIEMLVTLGIITLLTTMILVYSRRSESVSNLVREGNRMVFELQKAKSSAMLTLQKKEGKKACGWGVYIDTGKSSANNFIIFQDFCLEDTSENFQGNNKYDEGEKIEELELLKGIEIFETNFSSVVFVPPEPKIIFSPVLSPKEEGIIKIGLENKPTQYFEIKISPVGQIYKTLKTN